MGLHVRTWNFQDKFWGLTLRNFGESLDHFYIQIAFVSTNIIGERIFTHKISEDFLWKEYV